MFSDLNVPKPKEDDGLESIIVVDGIPQVESSRFDKLHNVITKIYSKFGEIINEYYPKNEQGCTKGWVRDCKLCLILKNALNNYFF